MPNKMLLYFNFLKHKFSLIVVLCSSITIYLPVIIFAHWGLFSDAGQIILSGREFWADPWNQFHLIKGHWRPAFHLFDLITYKLFGENPIYFYLVQGFMFLGTVILTYLNCLTLSRSRPFSTIFTLLLLVSTTTLEVIYTLDKGESRIAFFISLALFCYLNQDKKLLNDNKSNSHIQSFFSSKSIIIISISVFLTFFTKETSQILLVNIVTFVIATFILTLNRKSTHIVSVFSTVLRRFKWAFLCNLSIVFAFSTFKLFFYLTGGNNANDYLKIEYNLQEIYNNTIYYTKLIPDVIFILFFCMLSSIFCLVKSIKHFGKTNKFILPFGLLHSLNLTVISVVYLVALVNFRWKLVYIWFPINVFLIPASCYYFTSFFDNRNIFSANSKKIGSILLLSILLLAIPARLVEAQAIFNLDALKDDLATYLADYRDKQKEQTLTIVLPFPIPESVEIGERIEFFILEKFFKLSESRGFRKGDPFRVFNFVDYIPTNPNYPVPSSVISYPTKANTNSDSLMPNASGTGIQISAYEMANIWGARQEAKWTRSMLISGMYLVVPYGELPDTLHFRGAGLHQNSVDARLQFIQQVHWHEEMKVERSVVDIFGKRKIMGYKLLKITDTPPISWNLFTDGWLPRKTEIFFDKKIVNSVMTIQGLPFDTKLTKINFICDNNLPKSTNIHKLLDQDLYEFQVDLTCANPSINNEDTHKLKLDIEPSNNPSTLQNQDPRDLFFLVKKVYFSES